MDEVAPCDAKNLLRRVQHPSTTWMQQKSKITQLETLASKELLEHRAQFAPKQRWQFRTQDNTEAFFLYVPTHDLNRVCPAVFADRDDASAGLCRRTVR